MKENWNKLKEMSPIEKKYMLVVLLTFLLLVIGFSYAYFQAQMNDGTSALTNVKTGTVDNLTFSLKDIDVTDDTKNDEHNSDEEHDNSDIVINANQKNFGPDSKSLGDGVELSAHLLANDDTNNANARYNLFFVIGENDFEYTTEEERPEIILEVIAPNNNPVDNIKGLKKVEGGYDITKKKHETFLITSDYDINANPESEQKWQVKVTLVNFKDKDQNDNTGKKLNAQVYITTEKMPSYALPEVKTSEVEKTYNTITFTPTVNKGTENVVKYYYGYEKAQTNDISLMSAETVRYEETTEPSYTFEGLQPNTTYTIYSYVEDESGMKSNTYQTNVTTNEYKGPIINGVTFERGLYSIKATVNAIGRDGEIATYHYYKDGELITSIASNEYTYEGLSDTSSYELKIEVEDSNHVKSTAYEKPVSTLEYVYPEVESVDVSDNTWYSVTLTTNTKESTNPIGEYSYQVEKKDGSVVQEWFVGSKTQVINDLEANQEYNVKIKLKDSIGRESKEEYVQAISTSEYNYVHIDVTPTITKDSIKLDVSATPGTGTITKYMYSKNGGENWTEFESIDSTHSYTFDSLTSDTEFPIWVKVIDSNNKESNIYKETLTTSYIEPTSQNVVLTKIDGTSIIATLNVTQGSRPFTTYYFKVNDGESYNSSSSNTYNFEMPKTGNIKVEAYAEDAKGHTTDHVITSYTNPSLGTLNVTSTYKSVSAIVEVTKGDADVESYCFKVNEGECKTPTSIEGNAITYTFDHTPDTIKDVTYNVSVYAIDKNKRESNTVSGSTTIKKYEKATVDISLEAGEANNFKVVATGHKGTGEIKGYKYSSDGSSWTEVENNTKHTFENMINTTNTLYVQIVDEYDYTNQASLTYVDPSVSLNFGTVNGTSIGVIASVTLSKLNGTNQSISKYEYSNGGSSYAQGTNNTYTFTVPVEDSPTLYAKVTDNYGRQGIGNIKYENPSIGTPTTSNPTWNSLDVSVTAKQGTANIARYYFSSNDGTSFGGAVANTTTTGTTTLTGLDPSKEYNIRAYVEDANGRRSKNSEVGTGTTADYTYPTVTITSMSVTLTSITVNVSATNGTGTIKAYRYYLDGVQKDENITPYLTDRYIFNEGITEGNTYTIKVQAVDSNGMVSAFNTNNQKEFKIEILAAKCINQQVSNCFTASNYLESTLYYHDSSSSKGAQDDSYRYEGYNYEYVNNYVCLDGTSTTTGTCANGDSDLYRIIGLFKNEDEKSEDYGQYEMKLIKYDYATTTELGTTGAFAAAYTAGDDYNGGDGYYKGNKANYSKIGGYYWSSKDNNVNDWSESELRKTNLNTTYLNYLKNTKKIDTDKLITTHTWSLNGIISEIPNKIGLMYASDYSYASWLSMGLNEWTISASSLNGDSAYYIGNTGILGYSIINLNANGIRPCFYLTSSVKLKGGDGSYSNPYRVGL